jgi:hypothetical protein
MATAAVLAGNTSFYAIGQWIAGASQKTLNALGARVDLATGRYVGPDERPSGGSVPASTATRSTRRSGDGCTAVP